MQGSYYDGRTSARHPVTVAVTDERITLSGETVQVDVPIGAVILSLGPANTPAVLVLHDGAICEIEDRTALIAALEAAGVPSGPASRFERRAGLIAVSVALVAALAVFGYRYALPATAEYAVDRLPQETADLISRRVLQTFDGTSRFRRSRLAPSRRAALQASLSGLRFPGEGVGRPLRLVFRRSNSGPNAFALPSGVIVMTDALDRLARDDRELLGVFALEAGHVHYQHGLRRMFQSSSVALLLSWFFGDAGTILFAAPPVLLDAAYSRDFEREADAFAVETLRLNEIDPTLLADILERMEAEHARFGLSADALGYLSTHPSSGERMAALRAASGR